jgi:hypothetical protein
MAAPVLFNALFPNPLHKHATGSKNLVIIIATELRLGDSVNVSGTHGAKPTTWYGTITSHVAGPVWMSDDLDVDHEEERKGPEADAAGGTEDVSVTVTNPTHTSNNVIVPGTPIIP